MPVVKMTKNKVLLFAPKPLDNDVKYPPYPVLSLAGFLLQEGYEVKIIHASVDPDYPNKVASFLDDSVVAVGITSMTGEQIKGGIDVAKAVRIKNSNVPIVWGGYHPSLMPKETCASEFVDIVVKGQGEVTFRELCNALRDGEPLDNVVGIVFKKDGTIKENADRPFQNINNFPKMPWQLIDISKYVNEHMEIGKRTMAYITSQGCPFRCTFCAEPMVTKRRWSGIEAKRVVDDLEFLVKKYNVDSFVFSDSNFFTDRERTRAFCQEIVNRGLNIKWGEANGRTENLVRYDDALWELMVKAGLYSILCGAESGLPEALKIIEKDATVEDTVKFAGKAAKYGVRVTFAFMIGLPGMDINKEMMNTTELIGQINKIQKESKFRFHNRFFIYFYCPYPGTKLWGTALTYGFECPTDLQGWGDWTLDTRHCKWIPEGLDLKALRYIVKFAANAFELPPSTAKKIKSNPLLHIGYRVGYKMLHTTAAIRLKYKFFDYPVEFAPIKKFAEAPSLRTVE